MYIKEKEFLDRIEKHKGVIFKISKMYMDDRETQEDLFQEIIFQAWKSYDYFEGKSEFSTWLYKLALNTSIVYLKKETRRVDRFPVNLVSESIKNDDYNDTKDIQLETMYKAVQQLNAIDKALIFYFLEDYTGKQMAELLGISESNVRVKLNRAKLKLKKLIDTIK